MLKWEIVVRYEDIAYNSFSYPKRILNFAGLNYTLQVREWIVKTLMVSQERLIECKINILNAVMVINRSGGSTQDREIIIIWQSYLALEVKILSFRTGGPLNKSY